MAEATSLDVEVQILRRVNAQLREQLERRAFATGVVNGVAVHYCVFCSRGRVEVQTEGHAPGCILFAPGTGLSPRTS